MEKRAIKLWMFDGEDFPYWKSRTKAYLLSQGRAIWEIVEQDYTIPGVMRTSPCWIRAYHGLPQVTSRHQLGRRVRLGFSRHPFTVLMISPTSDVQTRRS